MSDDGESDDGERSRHKTSHPVLPSGRGMPLVTPKVTPKVTPGSPVAWSKLFLPSIRDVVMSQIVQLAHALDFLLHCRTDFVDRHDDVNRVEVTMDRRIRLFGLASPTQTDEPKEAHSLHDMFGSSWTSLIQSSTETRVGFHWKVLRLFSLTWTRGCDPSHDLPQALSDRIPQLVSPSDLACYDALLCMLKDITSSATDDTKPFADLLACIGRLRSMEQDLITMQHSFCLRHPRNTAFYRSIAESCDFSISLDGFLAYLVCTNANFPVILTSWPRASPGDVKIDTIDNERFVALFGNSEFSTRYGEVLCVYSDVWKGDEREGEDTLPAPIKCDTTPLLVHLQSSATHDLRRVRYMRDSRLPGNVSLKQLENLSAEGEANDVATPEENQLRKYTTLSRRKVALLVVALSVSTLLALAVGHLSNKAWIDTMEKTSMDMAMTKSQQILGRATGALDMTFKTSSATVAEILNVWRQDPSSEPSSEQSPLHGLGITENMVTSYDEDLLDRGRVAHMWRVATYKARRGETSFISHYFATPSPMKFYGALLRHNCVGFDQSPAHLIINSNLTDHCPEYYSNYALSCQVERGCPTDPPTCISPDRGDCERWVDTPLWFVDRPWFTNATIERPQWLFPYRDSNTGEWILSISQKRDENADSGVMAMDLQLNSAAMNGLLTSIATEDVHLALLVRNATSYSVLASSIDDADGLGLPELVSAQSGEHNVRSEIVGGTRSLVLQHNFREENAVLMCIMSHDAIYAELKSNESSTSSVVIGISAALVSISMLLWVMISTRLNDQSFHSKVERIVWRYLFPRRTDDDSFRGRVDMFRKARFSASLFLFTKAAVMFLVITIMWTSSSDDFVKQNSTHLLNGLLDSFLVDFDDWYDFRECLDVVHDTTDILKAVPLLPSANTSSPSYIHDLSYLVQLTMMQVTSHAVPQASYVALEDGRFYGVLTSGGIVVPGVQDDSTNMVYSQSDPEDPSVPKQFRDYRSVARPWYLNAVSIRNEDRGPVWTTYPFVGAGDTSVIGVTASMPFESFGIKGVVGCDFQLPSLANMLEIVQGNITDKFQSYNLRSSVLIFESDTGYLVASSMAGVDISEDDGKNRISVAASPHQEVAEIGRNILETSDPNGTSSIRFQFDDSGADKSLQIAWTTLEDKALRWTIAMAVDTTSIEMAMEQVQIQTIVQCIGLSAMCLLLLLMTTFGISKPLLLSSKIESNISSIEVSETPNILADAQSSVDEYLVQLALAMPRSGSENRSEKEYSKPKWRRRPSVGLGHLSLNVDSVFSRMDRLKIAKELLVLLKHKSIPIRVHFALAGEVSWVARLQRWYLSPLYNRVVEATLLLHTLVMFGDKVEGGALTRSTSLQWVEAVILSVLICDSLIALRIPFFGSNNALRIRIALLLTFVVEWCVHAGSDNSHQTAFLRPLFSVMRLSFLRNEMVTFVWCLAVSKLPFMFAALVVCIVSVSAAIVLSERWDSFEVAGVSVLSLFFTADNYLKVLDTLRAESPLVRLIVLVATVVGCVVVPAVIAVSMAARYRHERSKAVQRERQDELFGYFCAFSALDTSASGENISLDELKRFLLVWKPAVLDNDASMALLSKHLKASEGISPDIFAYICNTLNGLEGAVPHDVAVGQGTLVTSIASIFLFSYYGSAEIGSVELAIVEIANTICYLVYVVVTGRSIVRWGLRGFLRGSCAIDRIVNRFDFGIIIASFVALGTTGRRAMFAVSLLRIFSVSEKMQAILIAVYSAIRVCGGCLGLAVLALVASSNIGVSLLHDNGQYGSYFAELWAATLYNGGFLIGGGWSLPYSRGTFLYFCILTVFFRVCLFPYVLAIIFTHLSPWGRDSAGWLKVAAVRGVDVPQWLETTQDPSLHWLNQWERSLLSNSGALAEDKWDVLSKEVHLHAE